MEPALTIIIAIFGSTGFWALIQKLLERKSALRQMVFGIGYERLISACREYIEAGWIDLDELEELDKHLFQPYKAMGGNGTAELLMEKVRDLPNARPHAPIGGERSTKGGSV